MGRQRRIQHSGAIYHITSRGNRRAHIFVDDRDRHIWLRVFADAAARFNLVVYGFCLMPNHFHLLFETRDANLSAAMHYLNSKYAQKFNWRHALNGHVLQGRYDAYLVDDQAYLLEMLRYIVLNPVRSELVKHAEDWWWSTHRFCTGSMPPPDWLHTEWVLSQFSGATSSDRIRAYRAFVDAGMGLRKRPRGRRDGRIELVPGASELPSLGELESKHPDRDTAIRAAWMLGAYSREQIARHFGISPRTVSRITCR